MSFLDCINDTSGWTSDTSWFFIVVTDTKSPGPRQPVVNWIPRSAVVVYGVTLSAAAVILNILVTASSMFGGLSRTSGSDPRPSTRVRRLLTGNVCLIQLFGALFVVPVNVMAEASGKWTLGAGACRVRLYAQVLLVASTMWAVVTLVVDCLVRLVPRRRSCPVDARPRLFAVVSIVVSWVVSVASCLPIGLALSAAHGSDAVVDDEVCAVSLKRDDVLMQSSTAFLLPGAIAGTGCAIIVVVKLYRLSCRRQEQCEEQVEKQDHHEDDDGGDSIAVAAVGASCVVSWSPFFVVNILLPTTFCGQNMCIDSGTWTLLAWIGLSSVVLAPAFSYLDDGLRQLTQLAVASVARRCRLRCCCCRRQSTVVRSHLAARSGLNAEETSELIVAGMTSEDRKCHLTDTSELRETA